MIFTLLSKKEYVEANPLIKEKISGPFIKVNTEIYIIDSFEYAIELGFDANYLNDQIKPNVFWSDSINDTIKDVISRTVKICPIPIFSAKYIESDVYIEYENENSIVFLGNKNKKFYIAAKIITTYFSESISVKNTFTYKNTFRKKIKSCGFVEKEYSLENLEYYLQKLFGEKYNYYIVFVFKFLFSLEGFSTILLYENMKIDAWDNLFFAEEYFNNVKIYGLQQSSIYDFNFQKDEKGEYYVQYKYNAADSVTGRMFPVQSKGYQSLQTLPKESRHLLKAEKNCLLMEYDYKGFELSLFESIYNSFFFNQIIVHKDPHENICKLLKVDPIKFRPKGKEINYAIIYGMGFNNLIDLICESFSITPRDVVVGMIETYELYKCSIKLFECLESHITFINQKTFIQNEFKRCIKIEKMHTLLNNYISSTAADFLYCKINEILGLFQKENIGGKNKILLQNHDSILLQLEANVVLKTSIHKQIDYIMKAPIKHLCPDVELKVGSDWGNMS